MWAIVQATSAKHYGEKDARLEYLSWRVWFMKRNRALAKEERRKRDALLAEEGGPGPVQDEEGASHDGETSDDETIMPVTSTGSKGISFELEKKASQHLDKRKPSLPRVRFPAPLLMTSVCSGALMQPAVWRCIWGAAGCTMASVSTASRAASAQLA